MSDAYPLATEPERIVAPLLKQFHSGKVSAIMALYDAEAVFIANDEGTITDHTEIAARLERDLTVGLTLKAKARHVFVAGDIARIVLDWSVDGTGHDGKHVHLGGSASDIVRAPQMDDCAT
ncbi:YybH family protein [Bradyrhizobium sp. 1050_B9_N1_2]|uniref:YybH family protein n=1 Tax=Bradyrhizobium sp. 1050_B9_N1_2 TaxID=3238688 RepID=UPI003EDC2E63